jgi:hypothetical protein
MLYLKTTSERLKFPTDVYDQLKALQTDFAAKYAIAENPATRTKLTIQDKTTARNELEPAIRKAVAEYLAHNHLVTDTDRDGLGIPIRKTTHTPSPVAKTYPEFEIDTSVLRCLIINFHDQGSQSKAKPEGQHGAEIRWAIRDTPPTTLNDLTNSAFDTHTPFTLKFDENQRGQTVYLCLCWENTRGEKGNWSSIVSAKVP